MLASSSAEGSLTGNEVVNSAESVTTDLGEQVFYGSEGELELQERAAGEQGYGKYISVGDSLPYGLRLFYETSENFVRVKDIGPSNRILIIGVIGSFTPYCWNRHLFRVLKKCRYFEERGIEYICCIATNDAFTQKAWGKYLGCDDTILMFSDITYKFTQAIGMDVVIPWLDNNVRSRRYVLYVEDMIVSKMIVAPDDDPRIKWDCEHLRLEEYPAGELYSPSDSWI